MTAPREGGASPVMWVGLLAIAAAVVAISFAGQDSSEVGGFADPEGTGSEGLKALSLFIEEAGGTSVLDVANPSADLDVAILATPAYNDVFAEVTGEEDRTAENYAPVLAWVEAGGTLITSVDVPDGPTAGPRVVEDDDRVVPRGLCTLDALAALSEVRPLAHRPIVAAPSDDSCFGEGGEAVVVSRRFGDGRIVRLASMGLFFNRALDDADNAALAARLLRIDDEPTVGFLSGPPLDILGGGGNPVNEDGNPVGAGESSLLELVPARVVALLVGLGGAFLLYALSRGRRLGSPILEPVPIELPSSTYVDAVGRLYGRADQAPQRSAEILQTDLRNDLARRVGMSAESSATDLSGAFGTLRGGDSIVELLDRPPPSSDAELVELASQLNTTREKIDRGGVTSLLHSEGMTLADDPPIDTERTTDV